MDQYYNLLNARVFLYYDSQQPEKAREYVEECSLFVQLIKREGFSLEHELNQVFREEFYEKDYVNALAIAEQLIGKIEASAMFPKDAKGEFITLPKSLLARVLKRLERYEEALSIFEENPIVLPERIQLNPIDVTLRVISNSYEALCHYHLGNPKKAEELARYTVERIQYATFVPLPFRPGGIGLSHVEVSRQTGGGSYEICHSFHNRKGVERGEAALGAGSRSTSGICEESSGSRYFDCGRAIHGSYGWIDHSRS